MAADAGADAAAGALELNSRPALLAATAAFAQLRPHAPERRLLRVICITWAAALTLATIIAGCSAALVPLKPAEEAGLKEAQRIADEVTKAYGVSRVRVYASSGSARAAGTYSYRSDWIFLRPSSLTGNAFLVVLSHELGHATLGHRPTDVQLLPGQTVSDLRLGREVQVSAKTREAITAKEHEANHRGVEILVRFVGLTERHALERYSEYFIQANRIRGGKGIMMPIGHPMACDQLRQLWISFGQQPPECEIVDAPGP